RSPKCSFELVFTSLVSTAGMVPQECMRRLFEWWALVCQYSHNRTLDYHEGSRVASHTWRPRTIFSSTPEDSSKQESPPLGDAVAPPRTISRRSEPLHG